MKSVTPDPRPAVPHLTIQYTDNLRAFRPREALLELNQILATSGEFEEVDIKSRTIRLDSFLVGTSTEGHAFVHATLAILSGRSIETKRTLSETLLRALRRRCEREPGVQVQLCVEIQEIERSSYTKTSLEP